MQLQDLSTFLTVASERSFSSAAKKLHRTQPPVSQGIRRLEQELGERLFDRTSRTGTLTEAGRLLQDYALRLVQISSGRRVAVHRALTPRSSAGPRRSAPRSVAPDGCGDSQPQPRLRRPDVSAARQ